MKNFKILIAMTLLFSVGLIICADSESQKALSKAASTATPKKGPIARATNLPYPIVQLIAFLRGPLVTGIVLPNCKDPTLGIDTMTTHADGSAIITTKWHDKDGKEQRVETPLLSKDGANADRREKLQKTIDLRTYFGTIFIPEDPSVRAYHSLKSNRLIVQHGITLESTKCYSTSCADIEPTEVFTGIDPVNLQARRQASCCSVS